MIRSFLLLHLLGLGLVPLLFIFLLVLLLVV